MKKYGFLLIFLVINLSFFLNYYLISDLTFILDPDNYDILEFISLNNNNLIYVIFLITSVFLLNFTFLKNYFNKFFIKSGIYEQNNLTNKLQIRSPPFISLFDLS